MLSVPLFRGTKGAARFQIALLCAPGQVTWYRSSNAKYSGKWSPWLVSNSTGDPEVWRSRLLRRNIVRGLEDVTFTKGSIGKDNELKFDAAFKRRLDTCTASDFKSFK